MAEDFEVRGAEEFYRLSKALKAAGHTELRKELHKGLRDAVKPIMPKAKERLGKGLPKAISASAVRQVVQVKTGSDPGITVGVRYGSKRATNAQMANTQGKIRHPVFADGQKTRKQWRWVNQDVPDAKGWFDETYKTAAPEIRKALEQVVSDTVEKVVRGAH